jgi:hypothetical protein
MQQNAFALTETKLSAGPVFGYEKGCPKTDHGSYGSSINCCLRQGLRGRTVSLSPNDIYEQANATSLEAQILLRANFWSLLEKQAKAHFLFRLQSEELQGKNLQPGGPG